MGGLFLVDSLKRVDLRSRRFAYLRAVRESPRLAPVGSQLSLPSTDVYAPFPTMELSFGIMLGSTGLYRSCRVYYCKSDVFEDKWVMN